MAREPNRYPATAMAEAGISNKGLAKRMSDLTARTAQPIRADHNDVRKWLDGMTPRHPKPQVIAQVLSAKLGRRIGLDELGFSATASPNDDQLLTDGIAYPDEPAQSVELLSKLADADLSDRAHVVNALASDNLASQITMGYMFAGPVLLTAEQDGPIRGDGAANRIRKTTASLMQMDFMYGGGHTRRMLLEFFRDQVVPLLAKSHASPIRREVFSAAAEVAQLLGWSAYDAGRHGVAIRYFTQGLKLAREAGDDLLGGRMLSSLSHQANFLGNFNDAVMFARAAQSATVHRSTNTVSAMFLAMEARALASKKDVSGATLALSRAERLFETRNPDTEPDWIDYFDLLELHGEASHVFRDLGDSRQTKIFTAQSIDPVLTPPRTRAFIQMVSAAGSLSAGDPHEATTLAIEAIELADGLQSNRYVKYLTDFNSLLKLSNAPPSVIVDFTSRLRVAYPTLVIPSGNT